MSLGDPSPSPERGPQRFRSGPGRPHLEVRTLDPLAIRIDIENLDRLTDVLHLCGITPTSSGIEYIWRSLLRNKLPSVDDFLDAQGALGLNSELDISMKHEIECRGHHDPGLREYEDRVSVTLSTRHREGSELTTMSNLSSESPALDGLQLEIIASPYGENPALAHIFWSEKSLAHGSAGERWELIRGFYHHFNHRDLPEVAPVAAGQAEKFYYMSIELDPMTIKVQRLDREKQEAKASPDSKESLHPKARPLEIRLLQPSLEALGQILEIGGALQIQSPWMDESAPQTILAHLRDNLRGSSKLNIDELKMCDNALPCVIFSREQYCDGATFPPSIASKVLMSDYTCHSGDLRLEFSCRDNVEDFNVVITWDASPKRFSENVWNEIQRIAGPFLS